MEKGYIIPVLDHGFVRYVDHMGDDQRIVEAARISYKSPSKGEEQDKKLLHYLYKNKHCYHPDMEVLTIEGWKKWRECHNTETFLVPDPNTKTFLQETLPLEVFETDEEMYYYNNNRMSYCVSSGHRMWFKPKYSNQYSIYKIEEQPKWGHYDNAKGYISSDIKSNIQNEKLEFVGFYLGDGYKYSANLLGFRLKKTRKIEYLKGLLKYLKIPFTERNQAKGVILFTVDIQNWMGSFIDLSQKAKDKSFLGDFSILSQSNLESLLKGLICSDGSMKKDRPQIEISSISKKLSNQIQLLGRLCGFDAHHCISNNGVYSIKLYNKNSRTSLESRKQYYSRRKYKGKIYCTTTSTGLLYVRGGSDKFGFICGNTSPFEMVKVTLNIKLPIFVMRQYVRHRMQNLNEVSARYTELPNEFYIPKAWRPQDTKNKQGSIQTDGWNPQLDTIWYDINPQPVTATCKLKKHCEQSYRLYEELLEAGIAREMARMVLPVNIYTEIYATWDMKNLLHFIRLRDDSHAQYEIQEYGRAIKEICSELFPWTMEAYEKYK